MSQTQVQKEPKEEIKKKAAQQSGKAILLLLNVLATMLFPDTFRLFLSHKNTLGDGFSNGWDCLTEISLILCLIYSCFLQ